MDLHLCGVAVAAILAIAVMVISGAGVSAVCMSHVRLQSAALY